MKRMNLERLKANKNLKWKIFLLAVLLIIFIINLTVIHTQRSEERKKLKKELEAYHEVRVPTENANVPNFGTEIPNGTEDTSVPNFGTENFITNLEEYAAPLLEEDTYLLEESLLEYLSAENHNPQEAEIFHVMIPEDNENVYCFFLRLNGDGRIVKQEFDMVTKMVATSACAYTEDEVLSEAWEGVSPSSRDMQ